MRLKAIVCQVMTREMEAVAPLSPHSVEVEVLTMGLHDLGAAMRSHLQVRIDAADAGGYDALLLAYGLCGRGTEGLRPGRRQLVLPARTRLYRHPDGRSPEVRGVLRRPSGRVLSLARLDRVPGARPVAPAGAGGQ